jgi:protein-tyrosine phosphatase
MNDVVAQERHGDRKESIRLGRNHSIGRYTRPIRILFVCTGNLHRSPMAEVILSSLLYRRGIPADVSSVGLLTGGFQTPPETQDALRALGYDASSLTARRSRQLTDEDVGTADLVLGLARDHLRAVVVAMPAAWNRTFTLKELVHRGQGVGPRLPGQALASWLAAAGGNRTPRNLLGSSVIDDVADPIGGPSSAFEHTAAEIEGLCVSLSGLVWPSA